LGELKENAGTSRKEGKLGKRGPLVIQLGRSFERGGVGGLLLKFVKRLGHSEKELGKI